MSTLYKIVDQIDTGCSWLTVSDAPITRVMSVSSKSSFISSISRTMSYDTPAKKREKEKSKKIEVEKLGNESLHGVEKNGSKRVMINKSVKKKNRVRLKIIFL